MDIHQEKGHVIREKLVFLQMIKNKSFQDRNYDSLALLIDILMQNGDPNLALEPDTPFRGNVRRFGAVVLFNVCK